MPANDCLCGHSASDHARSVGSCGDCGTYCRCERFRPAYNFRRPRLSSYFVVRTAGGYVGRYDVAEPARADVPGQDANTYDSRERAESVARLFPGSEVIEIAPESTGAKVIPLFPRKEA